MDADDHNIRALRVVDVRNYSGRLGTDRLNSTPKLMRYGEMGVTYMKVLWKLRA